jgi:hypothetical protein
MGLDFLRELDRFEQIDTGCPPLCWVGDSTSPGDFSPSLRLSFRATNERESMQQTERYWKSKFARFVKSYGVDGLATRLDVLPSAVYHWIRGSTAPRPVHAEIIQRLARESGTRLTMDQIYGHFLALRAPEIPSESFLEASAGAARLAPRLESQWK